MRLKHQVYSIQIPPHSELLTAMHRSTASIDDASHADPDEFHDVQDMHTDEEWGSEEFATEVQQHNDEKSPIETNDATVSVGSAEKSSHDDPNETADQHNISNSRISSHEILESDRAESSEHLNESSLTVTEDPNAENDTEADAQANRQTTTTTPVTDLVEKVSLNDATEDLLDEDDIREPKNQSEKRSSEDLHNNSKGLKLRDASSTDSVNQEKGSPTSDKIQVHSQPAPSNLGTEEEDDFGDFAEEEFGDDFVEAPAGSIAAAGSSESSYSSAANSAPNSATAAPSSAGPSSQPPLRCLDMDAPMSQMRETLSEILPDFMDSQAKSELEWNLSREPFREIEGLSQVLVNEPSRKLFTQLGEPVPIASTPLNWKQSATRRRHLISLGIPVNLDEVHDSSQLQKVMPPLNLHVEASKDTSKEVDSSGDASPNDSPSISSRPSRTEEDAPERAPREEPPSVNMERVEELVNMSESQLVLKSLTELREIAREMRSLSQQTSDLLAHHLVVREALNSDAEMLNGMIRDLVAGASTKHASTHKQGKRGFLSRASSLRRSRPETPN